MSHGDRKIRKVRTGNPIVKIRIARANALRAAKERDDETRIIRARENLQLMEAAHGK